MSLKIDDICNNGTVQKRLNHENFMSYVYRRTIITVGNSKRFTYLITN